MIENTDRNKLIKIKVNYNGEAFLGVGDNNKSILEIVEDMGIPIRSACRKGLCGSCEIKLIEGKVISDNILDDNTILSCTSKILDHAEVTISYKYK